MKKYKRTRLSGKEPACSARATGDMSLTPGSGRFPWREKWQPISVSLPGKSLGQRSLAGYSPWGCKTVRHDLVTKHQHSLRSSLEYSEQSGTPIKQTKAKQNKKPN